MNENKAWIQIENEPPFQPEKIINIGVEYGEIEVPSDRVRAFVPSTRVGIAEYIHDGLRRRIYAKSGKWITHTDGNPLFHIYDLLEFDH